MANFSTNSSRIDPYKNFKFRIEWDGRYVAGAAKVSGMTHPAGRESEANKTRFDAITVERAVTEDPEFERWAGQAYELDNPKAAAGIRKKDLVIELLDEAGRIAFTYEVRGVWVSEYQALPDLDAARNAVAIAKLTLQHEGWTRSVIKSG